MAQEVGGFNIHRILWSLGKGKYAILIQGEQGDRHIFYHNPKVFVPGSKCGLSLAVQGDVLYHLDHAP